MIGGPGMGKLMDREGGQQDNYIGDYFGDGGEKAERHRGSPEYEDYTTP
jgi:hypothetical protein